MSCNPVSNSLFNNYGVSFHDEVDIAHNDLDDDDYDYSDYDYDYNWYMENEAAYIEDEEAEDVVSVSPDVVVVSENITLVSEGIIQIPQNTVSSSSYLNWNDLLDSSENITINSSGELCLPSTRLRDSVEKSSILKSSQENLIVTLPPATKDSSYVSSCSSALKIQKLINPVGLNDIAFVVKKNAKGRVRDLSLFQTFSEKIIVIFDNKKSKPKKIALLVEIFEGYAKLNINSPLLLDLCHKKFALEKNKANGTNALSLLYGSAVHALSGSSKAKVEEMFTTLSPCVDRSIIETKLVKLEIIKQFAKTYFPNIKTSHWPKVRAEMLPKLGIISDVQRRVSDFISSKGIKHRCEGYVPNYPCPVDIIALKSQNPKLKRNTIIEVDGPQHRDISGKEFLGKDILKNYILSQRWNLIRLGVTEVFPPSRLGPRLGKLIKEIKIGKAVVPAVQPTKATTITKPVATPSLKASVKPKVKVPAKPTEKHAAKPLKTTSKVKSVTTPAAPAPLKKAVKPRPTAKPIVK